MPNAGTCGHCTRTCRTGTSLCAGLQVPAQHTAVSDPTQSRELFVEQISLPRALCFSDEMQISGESAQWGEWRVEGGDRSRQYLTAPLAVSVCLFCTENSFNRSHLDIFLSFFHLIPRRPVRTVAFLSFLL